MNHIFVYTKALAVALCLLLSNLAWSEPAGEKWQSLKEGISYQVVKNSDTHKLPTAKQVIHYKAMATLEDGRVTDDFAGNSETLSMAASLLAMDSLHSTLLSGMELGETRRYRIAGTEFDKAETFPGQTRLITLTLVDLKPQIPAPENINSMPENAVTLPENSGFIYLVRGLDDGNHPALTDNIVVNYTGWNDKGEMFDSSALQGKPATFPLARLIKGYKALLPQMVRGDKVRAWFTPKMAYGHRPHYTPLQGTLVFEIELLDFKPAPSEKGDMKAG
jgi:FKBP-type peptidyl-prolyl cis-trans isomerase